MTGPQQSRPSPAPRDGGDPAGSRPSPRPRHGRGEDFPENSYQGGYPDLRSSRPVERPAPEEYPAGGYQDLYRGGGPMIDDPSGYGAPAGQAGPVRYAGYGAPVQGDGPSYPRYDETAGYGVGGDPAGDHDRYAAGDAGPGYDPYGGRDDYGDVTSRGGTVIDGGPPYTPAAPPSATDDTPPSGSGSSGSGSSGTAAAGTAAPAGTAAAGTALADDPAPATEATGPAQAAVPVQRAPAEQFPGERFSGGRAPADGGGRRPSTVAEAAAERFGAPAATGEGTSAGETGGRSGERAAGAPAVRVAKDPTAVTVLRVVTYLLVSLSCLVFLVAVGYGVFSWLEFRAAFGTAPSLGGLPGLTPPF